MMVPSDWVEIFHFVKSFFLFLIDFSLLFEMLQSLKLNSCKSFLELDHHMMHSNLFLTDKNKTYANRYAYNVAKNVKKKDLFINQTRHKPLQINSQINANVKELQLLMT